MDPRGAAAHPVEDPAGECEALAARANVAVPNIHATHQFTLESVADIRTALLKENLPEHVSICVFGSWARLELTPGSDDDWAVLAPAPFSTYDADIVRAMAIAQEHLGAEDHAPGSQGVFGMPFDITTLERNVGLDADTNTNLTRRMMLLFESRELAGTTGERGREKVLERYMNYGLKDQHPPRFLLNDLTRYWRTICVDFEGKHRDEPADQKWVSRNAKLRTSRKLLFAGGLIPVLLCGLLNTDEMAPFLLSWLRAKPLDRLAAAFTWAGEEDAGARALAAYDRWLKIQRDDDARQQLRNLSREQRHASPLFQEIKQIGRQFERPLISLLFESRLAALSRQYVVF